MKRSMFKTGGAFLKSGGAFPLGLLVGFVVAVIFCWFTFVRPLHATLDAREKSLEEWSRINRLEQQNIANVKTVEAGTLQKWVAIVDAQNVRFSELQRQLHQQEIDLTGTATTYIVLVVVFVLGVLGLAVYWLKSADAASAATLETVAALAPEAMVRSVLVTTLARHGGQVTVLDGGTRGPKRIEQDGKEPAD